MRPTLPLRLPRRRRWVEVGSPEQQIAQSAIAEMNWLQALWVLVLAPFLHGKFREMLFDRLLKRWFGGKPKEPMVTLAVFEAMVKRNDEQHAEGRHLMHEAISEFGNARRDIARVEGKVDTILSFVTGK
jgi:hypothetical protein